VQLPLADLRAQRSQGVGEARAAALGVLRARRWWACCAALQHAAGISRAMNPIDDYHATDI
jgi:hypothetical protein